MATTAELLELIREQLEQIDAMNITRTQDIDNITNAIQTIRTERETINLIAKPLSGQLPTFSGRLTENWNDFLNKFNRLALAGRWAQPERKLTILPTCLNEHAEKVFETLADDQKDTFDHLTTALGDKFNTREIQRLRATQFSNCIQESGESAEKFADRLQGFVHEAYPDLTNG